MKVLFIYPDSSPDHARRPLVRMYTRAAKASEAAPDRTFLPRVRLSKAILK